MRTLKTTNGPRGRTGFTLLEILVAIGAVALLSVGIAQIFESVGRTVTGGRRVSVLNSYASLLERQMREDFARMTRDGVLVIRHQVTSDGTGQQAVAALGPEDLAPLPRRIDEILFVASDQFASAREPLAPGFVPVADVARIYYGHGMRRSLSDPSALRPTVNDSNIAAELLGQPGANQFAKDWTLLRHTMPLVRPSTSLGNLPQGLVFGLDPNGAGYAKLSDKPGQIGLQPAVLSPFRVLALTWDWPPYWQGGPVGRAGFVRSLTDPTRPVLSSGIVDIAIGDLAEIRAQAMTSDQTPGDVERDGYQPPTGQMPLCGFTGLGATYLARYLSWLDELMPTNSDAYASATDAGVRIRYEPSPPDYVGVLTDGTLSGQPMEQAIRRADQLMLTSSNFVPRCTEFVVEWSFGMTYPSPGGLVWYGGDDLNRADPGAGDVLISKYQPGVGAPYPYQPFAGQPNLSDVVRNRIVDYRLIYGPNSPINTGSPQGAITARFGWIDPTWRPPSNPSDPQTIPMAWPRMIRVTLTLADPQDASIEQTFQFIFDTPGTPRP